MTREILHISLTQQGKHHALLRYFWDNPLKPKEDKLHLAEIEHLINKARTDYYTYEPVDYAVTGKVLYNWLDKSNRFLSNALNQRHQQEWIIAITTDEGLANLPWELLHDKECFLVEKKPSIVPVRWVSNDNNDSPIQSGNPPQNRPLNILFMATSPLGVEELNYEAEEGKILEATESLRTTVNLTVEESGDLTELGILVGEYKKDYFDIFHLIGHADHRRNNKPSFLTEDEYGNRVDSSTDDIVDALTHPLPPLIFLSGCRTAFSPDDTYPAMAEEFLNMGATAVLGWGEKVRDIDAIAAASQLYGKLSQGKSVTEAIASAYKALIKQKARDWHKLRLYVANTLPEALVTPSNTKDREQLPNDTTETEFWDDEKQIPIIKRKDFVGRRRHLQNCLRMLKKEHDKVGILIHGMGGLGKTSIASRLCSRLPEYEKVVLRQQINQVTLIQKLLSKLIRPELQYLRTHLEATDNSLDVKLTYLFGELAKHGQKLLLVLDDFEWNLEPCEGEYILKPEIAPILSALVEAIKNTGTNHRIIITCRYIFKTDFWKYFYEQGLDSFKKVELTKELSRLENFSSGKLSNNLRERALNLADGNPRLLKFLNSDVLGNLDVEIKLSELEQNPNLWKEKIIWEELYQLIDEPLQAVLSCCLVYNIPVPTAAMAALEAVCKSLPNYQRQLERGREIGLIEENSEPEKSKKVYRVSRILPHIIPNIKLPSEEAVVYPLYRKALEKLHELWALHELWGNQEDENEEKWQEIFRLTFADRENTGRFKQGFDWMLEVDFNTSASRAFDSELRQVADDLKKVKDNLFTQLEEYLKQNNWFEANLETLWIFYQLMTINECEDLFDLMIKFPCEDLRAIDHLWVKYSNGCFGFSVQKKMYLEVSAEVGFVRDEDDDKDHVRRHKVWEKFSDRVGWNDWDRISKLERWSFNEAPEGYLPNLNLVPHVAYIFRPMQHIGNREEHEELRKKVARLTRLPRELGPLHWVLPEELDDAKWRWEWTGGSSQSFLSQEISILTPRLVNCNL